MGRPRRVGLILPGVVGKVSLVKFEQLPSRAQDLDQLVRWQVRKSAPFAIEEAQVSYVPGLQGADGHEFVVTLAKRAIIEEYEELCAAAGAHAGIIDLKTLHVINAVLAGSGAHGRPRSYVAADYTSRAPRGGVFFRNRAAEIDGTLLIPRHQSAILRGSPSGGFSRVGVAPPTGRSAPSDARRTAAKLESAQDAGRDRIRGRGCAH
jgi:hypothetical protein